MSKPKEEHKKKLDFEDIMLLLVPFIAFTVTGYILGWFEMMSTFVLALVGGSIVLVALALIFKLFLPQKRGRGSRGG